MSAFLVEFFALFIIAILYLFPTGIAMLRKHNNATAIFALNFLLGWTMIGWVAALVWSLTADTEK